MPLYDYRCSACGAAFEMLVRGSTVPACPQCASTALERQLSLTAPQGPSKAAAREGHFSNYSAAERSKIK